jgi:hypothetical protein
VTAYRIDAHSFSGYGDANHTVEVNIPPAQVFVTAALRGVSGEGTSFAGIRRIRRRLDSGSDKVVDYGGNWLFWPAAVYDHISSVTFALAEGSEQEGWLLGRMDYWKK